MWNQNRLFSPLRMLALWAAAISISAALTACGGESEPATGQAKADEPQARVAEQRSTRSEEPVGEALPKLSEEAKNTAIESIKENPEVLDAIIFQSEFVRRGGEKAPKGSQINLTIVVTQETSRNRGRGLGEAFVRTVKRVAPEPDPGETIGTGIYDYTIAVYYPELAPLDEGQKEASEEEVDWDVKASP